METNGGNALFTATHSMISTYFGSITMVLKLPFTRAASTNGLQRYRGRGADATGGGGGGVRSGGKVAEVGVGARFGFRGARDIERLECEHSEDKQTQMRRNRP